MEYNINGILYFDKSKTTTFNNDIYELDEFKILKKWLIFKNKPETNEEIKSLELNIDLFIKNKIKNLDYNDVNIENNLSDIENNIPESFFRFKNIFKSIVEL